MARGLLAALLVGLPLAAPALSLHGSASWQGQQSDSLERLEEAAHELSARIDVAGDGIKQAGGMNAWEMYQALRSAGTMEPTDRLVREGAVQTLDENPDTGVWRITKHHNVSTETTGKEAGMTFPMPTGAPYKRDNTIQSLAGNMYGAAYDRFTSGLLAREKEMLDSSQRARLEQISQGKVTKKEIEIVVSHYDEEVEWMDMYSSVVTAYCKGDVWAKYPARPENCNQLPNVGREGHTFLHHIIQNYDKLADWTVFTQAQAPTSGWSGKEGDHRNGHIYPGATFHDYVLGGGPFAGENGDKNGSRFIFNGHWKPPQVGTQGWEKIHMAFAPHYYSDVEGGLEKRLTETCLGVEGFQVDLDLGSSEVMLALNGFIDFLGENKHDVKYYSQGARFALSRERILQRPKEFYTALRGIVNREIFPISSVFLELLWYYIPGSPDKAVPCQQELRAECPAGFEIMGSLNDDAPNGRIKTIRPVTIDDCAAQCTSEPTCGSFMHNEKAKTCVFLSVDASTTRAQIGFWPGAVTCKKKAAAA